MYNILLSASGISLGSGLELQSKEFLNKSKAHLNQAIKWYLTKSIMCSEL